MKKHSLILLASLAGMLMIYSSCQKQLDVTKQTDEINATPLPSTTTYCRIEFIQSETDFTGRGPVSWAFLYDEFENPTLILTGNPILGRGIHRFKYDDWHRLKEYRKDDGNLLIEEWHFYGFDLNGRIGSDTAYAFGTVFQELKDFPFKWIENIQYDNQGRIIRVERLNSSTTHYEYDFLGNLVYPGVVYDDKVNMNRTNDIWQFLTKNYSVNNSIPFAGTAFNSSGYATIINGSNSWITGFFQNAQITYACRQSYYF